MDTATATPDRRTVIAGDIVTIARVLDLATAKIVLHVALVQRPDGQWAVPGGKLELDETITECAARELHEETGLRADHRNLQYLGYFDNPTRDPRPDMRVVSVTFLFDLDRSDYNRRNVDFTAPLPALKGEPGRDARWFLLDEAMTLPLFVDHNDALGLARDAARRLAGLI
jgi:ADP-ribose pyrophosphatase YjhB (NUDIX family)